MKVLVSGATGLVGRALCQRLLRDGHEAHAVVRDVGRAAARLGPKVAVASWQDEAALLDAVRASDALVHLAGEPIVGPRWSDARKQALRDSRIATAQALGRLATRRASPWQVVLGASAIGFYGDRGDEVLTEASAGGDDFAARLCRDWEAAAAAMPAARHVHARIGLVLGQGGGMLATMEPTFRRGLGAVLGDGAAWQAWIHLDDVVAAITIALASPAYEGVYNLTAPAPVTNRELSHQLAARFGRKVHLGAPRFALRVALGEAAGLVLASTKAMPTRLLAQGFAFQHATLPEALAQLYP